MRVGYASSVVQGIFLNFKEHSCILYKKLAGTRFKRNLLTSKQVSYPLQVGETSFNPLRALSLIMSCKGLCFLVGSTKNLIVSKGTFFRVPFLKNKKCILSTGTVILPKEHGGLGIHETRPQNLTLITKLNWRLLSKNSSPRAQVLKAK